MVVTTDYKTVPRMQPRPHRRRRRTGRIPNWFFTVVLALIVVCLSPNVVPPPPDWSTFSSEAGTDVRALILTAHPDDECMFFSPTILSLRKQDVHVKSLCLSSGMPPCSTAYMHMFILQSVVLLGNATGLGAIRSRELIASYRVLGVQETDVTVQDHM